MKKSVEIAKPIAQDYGNVNNIKTDLSAKPYFKMMKDSITGNKMIVVAYPNKWKTDYGERIVVTYTETAVFIDAETMTPFEVSNGTEICKVLNREISEKLSDLRSKYHKISNKRMENNREERRLKDKLLAEKLIPIVRPIAMKYGKVDGEAPIFFREPIFEFEKDPDSDNHILVVTFVREYETKKPDYVRVFMDVETETAFFVNIRYEKGTVLNQQIFDRKKDLFETYNKIMKAWGKE
jgi:hypothetical protein